MCHLSKYYSILLLFFSISNQYTDNTSNAPNYMTVVKNQSLVFDTTVSTTFGIVEQPQYGQLLLNADNRITYKPQEGICEKVDVFKYFHQSETTIDTVTVYVEILCEALTIINGFGSNTEGTPTTFTIIGIENYPENTLSVFNDKGNQVYYKKGYLNDWDGRKEGEPLPEDFTYYYVLNDGQGKTYSGYLRMD